MNFVDDIYSNKKEELEDVNLTSHMDSVRELLKKYNTVIDKSPEDILEFDKKIRIEFSDMIINIKEQLNDLIVISDNINIISNHTNELSNGIKPYYYSECSTSKEIFLKINTESCKLQKLLCEIISRSTEFDKKINIIRRMYESIYSNTCMTQT
jgi:hypothetical protein